MYTYIFRVTVFVLYDFIKIENFQKQRVYWINRPKVLIRKIGHLRAGKYAKPNSFLLEVIYSIHQLFS